MMPNSEFTKRYCLLNPPGLQSREAETAAWPLWLFAPMLALLLLIVSCPATAIAGPVTIDRVVAEVNGEIITMRELESELAEVRERLQLQAPEANEEELINEARRQVLAGMIDRLLVEQHAARRGIKVGDPEVDAAIARMLDENRVEMEQLLRDLERNNTTMARYRRDLRTQIIQARLLEKEVREQIVIPEEKLKRYYQEHYAGQEPREDAYHILQMGFTWSDNGRQARDEALRRAKQVREEVLAGAEFRESARRQSDLPSAGDGGDLGVFTRDELSGAMRDAILALQPGEISPILETQAGYQFFKLLSNRGNAKSELSYQEAREEIRELLYNKAMEERFAKWVENLRSQAYIKIML